MALLPLGKSLGRQSLVTPIDWKRQQTTLHRHMRNGGRQSLVTPIDWKKTADLGNASEIERSPILGDAY